MLEERWYGAARPPLALRLLARMHALVLSVRRGLYAARIFRTTTARVPVIVVGNITAGGTGKTPLTAWIVERLAAAGHRPGIASRGFGRSTTGVRMVEPGDEAATTGDEPLMLRRQTGMPVCVAARRADAAALLAASGCDVVVCDDGLQHLALDRQFEIAVIDGARGLGNGYLLPAGPLREGAERLRRVDAVVVNGRGMADTQTLPADVRCLRMELQAAALRSLRGGAQESLDWLAGRAIHAVAGIGNPGRFFGQLERLGAVVQAHPFPDHHRFSAADIRFEDDRPVIMTAKDAVKCSAFADARHYALEVRAHFAPQDDAWLVQRLVALAGTEGSRRG